jgi:mitochondrial fission protein ELM1
MTQQVDQHETSGRPRVWLVMGEKRGDNAQIMNLAEGVGWDYEVKNIFVKPQWVTGKPKVRPTLDHVDLDRSDSLEAPWPDLVMTAGRRLSCVGFWIKRASAGKTRLVMIGKPRRLLDSVDLIVVANHYVLKPGPNVIQHDLPLMHVDPKTLENAISLWGSRLADVPRPLTALMVGGPTGGLRFDLSMARDLFDKTIESVKSSGGSLYMTTSRRTPPEVAEMLRRECPESARLFEFDADAPPSENPYHALLAMADRFIVTTDSASMMVEVAQLGRSLSIHPLESQTGVFERGLTALGLVRPLCPRRDPIPAGGLWARTLYRLGQTGYNRDLSAISRLLVEKGRACWLGDDWVDPLPFVDDELDEVAERIRALVRL